MRFADTSFWYALQERRDRHHVEAAGLARAERTRVVTSNHIVGETWTLLVRRAGSPCPAARLEPAPLLRRAEGAQRSAKCGGSGQLWGQNWPVCTIF
ncbi:MAG: PIN domain-containing protein [Mycobacteriales bacterium]